MLARYNAIALRLSVRYKPVLYHKSSATADGPRDALS